jgi:autotransporter-associated beta strand protein
VTGVAAGSSTITVTKAADSTYAAATATLNITVTSSPSTTTPVGAGSSVSLSGLGTSSNPVLSGGTVTLTSGDSSSVPISVTGSGGTIQTPTSGSATLSGALSGSGGLTFAGTGTTVLTGTNTYSGGTTVSGGTLQGNTSSLQGSITNNGRVVFDQPGSGTFSGTIAGPGAVVLQNTGTVVLSGNNSYSGGTTVSGGTLVVSGSSPTRTGDVVVSSAGTLMGTGTISGNSMVSGVFKPGNSPGYLSMLQNLTLNTGASYQEDIAGTTPSSSTTPVGATGYYAVLNVGGQLTINSGVTLTPRLSNLFSSGEAGFNSPIYVPALGHVFRMATATGGISGRFATLTQPAELTSGTQLLAFYNVNNSNSLDLAVVPVSYSTSLAGSTPAVVSAASVLDQWVVLNKAGTATAAQNQVLFGVASQTAAAMPAYVQAHLGEILVTENAPIPTLSEWAMILLASLMGTLGLVRMRRGRQNGFAGDHA